MGVETRGGGGLSDVSLLGGNGYDAVRLAIIDRVEFGRPIQ
jgi:hypothetical protein